MLKIKYVENFDGLDDIDIKDGYRRYTATVGDWFVNMEGNDDRKEVVVNIWHKDWTSCGNDRYVKSFKGAKRYATNFLKAKGVL